MKKSFIIASAALILALALSGCCSKKITNSRTSEVPNSVTDAEENYLKNVDMDKVDGKEATSQTAEDAYMGTVGNSEVVIGDAKVIEYEGENVVIVSFTYRNNASNAASFQSKFDVSATQDESLLPPAVVADVEGVDTLSTSVRIETGDTITVQKAFKLRDTSAAVKVELKEFGKTENVTAIEKVFDL